MKKILIIGNGGREQAIAWKLSQDSEIKQIYIALGNGGSFLLDKTTNISANNIDQLANFATDNQIDLTIVGPEAWLVDGIVDRFKQLNLAIFGANQKSALLEGDKQFAKNFMQKYGVKTADYNNFNDYESAIKHLNTCNYPTVIKASGLASGKGVVICQDQANAQKTVQEMMKNQRFGKAGEKIVIEQFLTGFEASILAFYDGKTLLPLLPAKDHKTISENNQGENTGGMGVVCPHPLWTEKHNQLFYQDILNPTLKGLNAEGFNFAGVIFFGLMVNESGIYLIEYNMRMGDPETQAVLPLLKTPLYSILQSSLNQQLAQINLEWQNKTAVCVVAASKGYPNQFQTDLMINGLTDLDKNDPNLEVFVAGAKKLEKNYFTSGGRVLNLVGLGENLASARENAYQALTKINFKNMVYRKDIGND